MSAIASPSIPWRWPASRRSSALETTTDPKPHKVCGRLNDADYELLRDLMKRTGQNISDVLRAAIVSVQG